ncbi:SHOCT domain-containing protein [Paraglaciecola sp. MB-3u-78]|uniref:SHOCT domain-containing protein n=1 Tax=Paraglaciecola sp. MB-3u-78 TaxID=2058332 RepID=UPI0012FE95D0|nr:SHOCT domain-containing protein [Paraglaciecola sp. MB-3u-78]
MDNQTVINFHRRYLHIVFYTMAICTLFSPKIVFADQYQLQLIVDLSELNDEGNNAVWLEPLASPTNNGEFFVAQDNGRVYLTSQNPKSNQKTILNLPLTTNSPGFISLTAMTLHPNFTSPEHSGYATIFTAHTTEFHQKTNNNRLTLNDTNITFGFETVITAWQYDFEKQKIDPKTKREVLRIPINKQDSGIRNLKFDPYQKTWNLDYAQLYFSLNHIDELKDYPLYSGVILRIDPHAFGEFNYTVLDTNPFIKDSNINNEIVVMGVQNIERFFRAKNEHTSIFIQHNNNEQHRLSKAILGDNLLTQSESNILWQQPNAMSAMLLYQGRDFMSLRDKMVFITLLDNKWHLGSLALVPLINELPIFEELLTKDVLSPTSDLNIYQDNQNEIILFDNHKSKMYSLQLIVSKVIESVTTQSNTTAAGSNNYILHISLLTGLLLLLIFVYRKKMNNRSSDSPLDKDHLQLKYEPTTQIITLFKANQKKDYKTLTLDDIIRCEILLNKNIINTIDDQPDNALNNQIEVDMRALFSKEYYTKMDDEDTRQIEIVLSVKGDSFRVSLYLRKGNSRVTGTKYDEIIDILVDLCWSISKCINHKDTEARIIPIVKYFHPSMKVSPIHSNKSQQRRHKKIEDPIQEPAKYTSTASKFSNQVKSQTELVDALDKLVNLHQQGYLSDEEFSLAKTKLLK